MDVVFNLVDEPWLPCLMSDGSQRELSLRQTLRDAASVQALVGETPPVTIALHRLLLAVVHRVVAGPRDLDHWVEVWRAGALDGVAIDRYLDQWRPRFDLFDDTRPVSQTAAAGAEQAGSIAKLLFQADNNATLFEHTAVADPPALSPARAARWLVATHAFDTGGLKTGTGNDKSAKASLLIQCVVCLARGANLFETLLLNLHRVNGANSDPFEFDAQRDHPAWEREAPTTASERDFDGYLDLLTWQSRRLRLFPDVADDGTVVVRRAALMKGHQLPDDASRHGRETMVAFRKNPNPKAPDPWPPLGFQEERALWRDSAAYLQSVADERERPRILDQIAILAQDGTIGRGQSLPLDVLGLAADRAKLLFWRHERLTVPFAYLADDEAAKTLFHQLREALNLAEAGERLLRGGTVEVRLPDGKPIHPPSPMRRVADEITGGKDSAPALVEHLAPRRGYWQRLDAPFQRLLTALPEALRGADDDWEVGPEPLTEWADAIGKAARAAFHNAVNGMERSTRGLRAVALGERELNARLATLLADYQRPLAVSAGGGV